ncbi:putative methionine--tRNA ligase, cytoplasmic [Colletotrichum fructicola]|uniref:methionine--tRNA ligase n=1 Tax=Colletotrichum fructicola (strain Nara gc5) TaxID=1213859 RepID=L2FRA2_COLFN|nr:putative methionine--tRNA ligase, cytoplasmic [Colletotrichum fructicola]KAE9573534.1 putative methionine--tRNA ligase, cytoplasmic [Colletotrichum fructicola]KAF4430351.1 putative methionine-tRNA ligase [Colletotrichum fructicola]KAF4484408.1 putative methionine--tRNA ligase [Colletotrichum fructicola Nara gc5]KAF4902823.1 putative methionine--tRNA ligase [Colletotrichum fructicola]
MAPTEPILPVKGKNNILITSALPYVNNVPHLGNIIGSVLSADVFARYSRARGNPTIYICGSDEYGTATETKALEEGVDPATLCAKYHAIHKGIYDYFDISFDIFGRTPTPQQTEIVQDIFTKLWKNGYIEERETIQPFCPVEAHNTFLADRFVEGTCSVCNYDGARGDQCDKCGNLLDPLEPETDPNAGADDDVAAKATGWLINPRCKLDGATPEKRKTKHLFLKLDALKDELVKWFQSSSKKGAWSNNAEQITQAWIDKGLKPRGITRDLKWGVPIPTGEVGEDYARKVFYVWFDACIGYVSITKNYTDGDNLEGKKWEQWWKNPDDVKLYQFMGKDNVQFHTIIFPGSQLGTGENWTKLHKISTTEYLNYEGGKFSKSRGVGVFGNQVQQTEVPVDVWRYYLLARRPETSDSEFMWQEMVDGNNNELLKNLGNFCQRVNKFCQAKTNGAVPDYTKYTDDYLKNHVVEVNNLLSEYIKNMEDTKMRASLHSILSISALGNKLLQDNKLDNKLLTEEPDRCAAVVGHALNQINLIASLVSPFLPNTSKAIFEQLGVDSQPTIPDSWVVDPIKPGHKLGEPKHLFSLIPATKIEEWKDAFGGEEVRKQKEEAAAKAAAKKAAKEADKARKKAKKEAEKAKAAASVESGEKKAEADPAIESVTEAIAKADVHTS